LVKQIRIEDYTYNLPDEKIARYPLPVRDQSKLLIYRNKTVEDRHYYELDQILDANTHLVFNQTKVIQARLLFPKNEQTTIEVFCLEPANGTEIQLVMQQKQTVDYQCMVGGARKWKSTPLHITLSDGTLLKAEKVSRTDNSFIIRFKWDNDLTFAEILEQAGKTPLPPYLNRLAEDVDKKTYQTVFAKNEGSVAAPTAGLHFTPELLGRLNQKGIGKSMLTLHVGAGTFKPVSTETIEKHHMHSEEFLVQLNVIEELLAHEEKNIIPVGTTAMRALESYYWLGLMLEKNPYLKQNELDVPQWIAYETEAELKWTKALDNVRQYLIRNKLSFVTAKTSIIIAPGYNHKICTALLTNFHQPNSTLLLLVASLIGDKWKSVYQYALKNDYRFLSYGDGCLIFKH